MKKLGRAEALGMKWEASTKFIEKEGTLHKITPLD
jgi:hypothetical protein